MSAPGSLAARLFLALLVARVAHGVVFLAASLRRFPIPWYLPLERRWVFESAPSGLAMAWFGVTGAALAAGAVFGVLAFVWSGRPRAGALVGSAAFLGAVARAGALVLAVDFVYFGWRMMNQTPEPLVLPAGPGR
jgi:hypothetical protein